MESLLGAVAGNEEASHGFTRMMAGTVSPADFFAEENVERILTADTDLRMRAGRDSGATSSRER